MVTGMKVLKDPFVLITIFIGVVLLTQIAVTIFPLALVQFALLGTLANFTFASLFTSGSLISIILSVLVLVAVLALLGIKMKGTSGR